MKCLLLTAICTTKTHGWLLQKTLAAALTASIVFVAIVECALLLSWGVDTA
jgi:hypothetical protein